MTCFLEPRWKTNAPEMTQEKIPLSRRRLFNFSMIRFVSTEFLRIAQADSDELQYINLCYHLL